MTGRQKSMVDLTIVRNGVPEIQLQITVLATSRVNTWPVGSQY